MKELELKKSDLKLLRLKTALAELEMKLCEREIETSRIKENITIQQQAISEVEKEKQGILNG